MKVDVKFVHFHVPELVRDLVEHKVQDLVDKFSHEFGSVRFYVCQSGNLHKVRINVAVGKVSLSVKAEEKDAGRAVDQAMDKLASVLRKVTTKRKDKKFEPPSQNHSRKLEMSAKGTFRRNSSSVNAFDKYEREFADDFEQGFDMVG